jgi:hypothetical protein
MSSTHKYRKIKVLPQGSDERRAAIRAFLSAHPGIISRAADRAEVGKTMVSKVLNAKAVSRKVEAAILAEESVKVAQRA